MDEELALLLTLDPGGKLMEGGQDWLLYGLSRLAKRQPGLLCALPTLTTRRPHDPFDSGGILEGAPISAAIILFGQSAGPRPGAVDQVFAATTQAILKRPAVLTEKLGSETAIEAGRGLRRLLRGDGVDLLGALEPTLSVADVATCLRNLEMVTDPHTALARRYLVAIGRLVALALAPPPPAPPPPTHATPSPPPPNAVVRPAGAVPSVEASTPAYVESKTLDAPGVPDTASTLHQFGRTLPGLDRISERRARDAMDRLQIRAAAAAAQDLAIGDLQAVTSVDVAEFGASLRHAVKNGLGQDVAALGIAAVYAGVSPRAVQEWPVFDRPSPCPSAYVCRSPLAFFVPAHETVKWPAPPATHAERFRATESHAVLPLPPTAFGIATLCHQLESCRDGDSLASVAAVDAFGEFVESFRSRTGSPLTLRRFPSILPEALRAAGVGRTATALMLGRPLTESTLTPLLYYSPTRARLAELYVQGARMLSRALGTARCLAPRFDSPIAGYVGGRRCPTSEAVHAVMAALRAREWSAPRGRPHPAVILEDYLLIQALVVEVVLWCTGARPTEDALDALLYAEDLLLLDDKTKPRADGSSARVVPLATVLRDDLLPMWRDHRAWTWPRLGLRHEPPPFFQMSLDGSIEIPTIAEMRARLALPTLTENAHRHFFLTEIEARGAGPAAIEHWAGHWRLGSEPGHGCSSRAAASVSPADRIALDGYAAALNFPCPRRRHDG